MKRISQMTKLFLGIMILMQMLGGEHREALAHSAQPGSWLRNDFLIHNTPYFENTAKVIPPSPGCPQGKIVLSTGQTNAWNTGKILHRPLYDYSSNPVQIDTTSPTSEFSFVTLTDPTKAIATDNQTVRLNDGSLLIVRDGFSWDDISPNPPAWFNETVTGFGDHKGQRGGPLIFRSTDCGVSWVLHSTIDLATLFGGKYGSPRPMDDSGVTLDKWIMLGRAPMNFRQGKYPDGSLKWFAAGADRTEVYVCPFTGHIYVTTRVISGPYPYTDINQRPLDTALLLYSKDNGRTWEVVKEDLPAWTPIVMTSTPNGRLFLFQLVGDKPTIYFSMSLVAAGQKPIMSQGYQVYYVHDTGNLPSGGARDADVDLFKQMFHPSISRVSTDTTSSKVRMAYHFVNSFGMQETAVITVDVQDPNSAPVVKPVRIIRAHDPKNYSVLYLNFIDPDYIDMPSPSNTSVAYWIEVPRPSLTDKKFAIKQMTFEGDFNTFCAASLSVQDGEPRTWSTSQPLGDYMTGGFFWSNSELNYLAQWVEPTGIRANIIRLPYKPPSSYPIMTVSAVWRRDRGDEVQVFDVNFDDFNRKYNELWPQGWRLHILENRVVNNQVLYTAIWRPSTADELQFGPLSHRAFLSQYDALWRLGFRLHLLANPVVNGQVLYFAVWRRSTEDEIQVNHVSKMAFLRKYDELRPQGWRLHLLENPVVNGRVLYTAVWRRSPEDEIQVYQVSYDDFKRKYDELAPQGWRLHLLENPLVNGQLLYTAVWRPSTKNEMQVYHWSYEDFSRKYDEIWCDGWRLRNLAVSRR